ncbi:MAG: IclR family transcriptional regulator [Lysobacteraceae bacterium]|nr:MAG: IclR family transcriptional regulator [Xanthomonadaceae bacterium]
MAAPMWPRPMNPVLSPFALIRLLSFWLRTNIPFDGIVFCEVEIVPARQSFCQTRMQSRRSHRMAKETAGDASSSGIVGRVTALLKVLAETEGDSSLSEIAARMNLPPSSTHRLLHLLLDEGFVDRGTSSRTYRAGLELHRVGGLLASRADVPNLAHSFMQAVVDACDETCMLSLYVPRTRSAMVARAIHGSHPLRYEAALYVPSSLAWGATGLGILAFLPDATVDEVLKAEGPSPADARKPVKPAQLRRELAKIREQGYAHTHSQKIKGAVGFSAPVFNSGGVVAALCITLPDSRYESAMESRLAQTLMAQADLFSASLGWRRPAAARAA